MGTKNLFDNRHLQESVKGQCEAFEGKLVKELHDPLKPLYEKLCRSRQERAKLQILPSTKPSLATIMKNFRTMTDFVLTAEAGDHGATEKKAFNARYSEMLPDLLKQVPLHQKFSHWNNFVVVSLSIVFGVFDLCIKYLVVQDMSTSMQGMIGGVIASLQFLFLVHSFCYLEKKRLTKTIADTTLCDEANSNDQKELFDKIAKFIQAYDAIAATAVSPTSKFTLL